MISSDDTSIRVLNTLISFGLDAERGFQTAAVDTRDPEHARSYCDYAVQRARFVAELQDRVKTLRADPATQGSLAAAVHRQWMDLEAATSNRISQAILTAVERGEALAVAAYGEALQTDDLDEQTRNILQQQYEQVQAVHDRVKQLRDRATASLS